MMKILIKEVGKPCRVAEYDDFTYIDMQGIVGGLIECIYVEDGLDMWCNDEGKLMDLPVNVFLSRGDEIIDAVCGDIFFARNDGYGETIGLTDEDIVTITKRLDTPYEMYYFDGRFVPVWGLI